jgi:hypothetical protein
VSQQTRLPASDSGVNEWTALGGGTHFSEVDDAVGAPDDDTTYVSTAVSDKIERFNRAAFALPAGAVISAVDVVVRCKMTAGTGNIRPLSLVNGSTTFFGSPQAVSTSWATYTGTLTTNPGTTVAWTKADVEGTSGTPLDAYVGFYSHNLAGGTLRLSACYIAVTYTVPAAGDVAFARPAIAGVGTVEAAPAPSLPQLFYDILGPVLSGAATIALGGDLATHENFFTSTPLNVSWGPDPKTAAGWCDYHWEYWLAHGSPGLPSSGAGYDVPRILFAAYVRYKDENPTLAQKFYDRACVMAKAYVDEGADIAKTNPLFGWGTPHFQPEGMALYYLATGYALARTGLGLAADRHTEAGYSLANLSDPTFVYTDSRERARALTSVIMAWLVDAPTAHAGFGGSWLTQGNTLIPAMIDAFIANQGFLPNAAQTVDDTNPRIDHPGTYRHMLHDYYEKVFQDALFNDALIEADRLCAGGTGLPAAVLSGAQRTAIRNAVAKNVDYQRRVWDAQNKCFPYVDATYNASSVGGGNEQTGPSPDNNAQFLNSIGWLGYVTGDPTWFTFGDQVLDGALHSVYYSANSQPSYVSAYIPKQYSELFTPHNYAAYKTRTPLATPVVPVTASGPTINGTPIVGSVLTCDPGTWSNTPTSYTYQWLRMRNDSFPFSGLTAYLYDDGGPPVIVGTNAATYTLVSGDAGKKIRCVVTASNASGAGVPAVTAKTALITLAGAAVTFAKPTIASVGTVTPAVVGAVAFARPAIASTGTMTPVAGQVMFARPAIAGVATVTAPFLTVAFAAPTIAGVGTMVAVSSAPSNPTPGNGASGVSRTPTVSFTAAPGATCLVYFSPLRRPWPRPPTSRAYDIGNPAGMPSRSAIAVEGPSGVFSVTLDLLASQADMAWIVISSAGASPVWTFRTT